MARKKRSSVYHKGRKTVALCGFVKFEGHNSPFKVACRLYLYVVNRFCSEKWRTKSVFPSTTKDAKLLLFVGLSRFKRQNSPFEVPCRLYLSVVNRFCYKRNGVKIAFFGQPQKAQNCCFLWISEDSRSKFSIRSSMQTLLECRQ